MLYSMVPGIHKDVLLQLITWPTQVYVSLRDNHHGKCVPHLIELETQMLKISRSILIEYAIQMAVMAVEV